MCFLEELILDQCPNSFKPIFYKRYVDDTFVLFNDESHAQLFLNFINEFHPNIRFSMDKESNNQISFLDILISRCNGQFVTGVYRKSTFTGLGLNFFSHCYSIFKSNSCKTLLSRAYSLSSSWIKFHEEISFLRNYFIGNCYPSSFIDNILRFFLDNVFRPKLKIPTVPKKLMYVSLPYTNYSAKMKKELTKELSKLYTYVDFKFIFNNPLKIGSMFSFKDTLTESMRSCLVYKFTCPKCNFGTYVGCTKRLLKVRIDSHRGVSHRTGCGLSNKENSAIRLHTDRCRHHILYSDFQILSQSANQYSLPFSDSLYIKQLAPNLNNQTTSVPLYIA